MIIDFDIGKLLYEAAIYAFIAIFIGLSQVTTTKPRPQVSEEDPSSTSAS